jgi:hypothetical protein
MTGTVTVRYGLGNEVKRQVETPVSVSVQDLVTQQVRDVLGIPQNVSYFVNGVEIGSASIVNGGDVIEVQAKACAKACAKA